MKPNLFTYSAACSQSGIHAILNATDVIEDWIAPFPYSAIEVHWLNQPPHEVQQHDVGHGQS